MASQFLDGAISEVALWIGRIPTDAELAFHRDGGMRAVLGVDGSGFDGGLITNPSFETDTTGWSTNGNTTLTRVSAAAEGIPAKFGDFVLKVTIDAVATAQPAIFVLTLTDVLHDGSAHVYIPSAWDGSVLTVRFQAFAGGSAGTITAADTGVVDAWQEISELGFNPDAGDLTGDVRINSNGASIGAFFYVDGASARPS